MCCKSRLHEVGNNNGCGYIDAHSPSSNLTFGAGGKDKDGNNVTGWGYYEVYALLAHP